MRHLTWRSMIVAVSCLGWAGAAAAEGDADRAWNQFRGPDRTGISNETGWSVEGKSEPVWSKNVGLGYSGLSIADGRLYTLGYDEAKEEDVIYCLDALTGKEVWTHRYPSAIWNRAHRGGTLSTPTVDGDVVYFSDREGKFFCFEAATGKVVWKKDLKAEYNLTYPTWGFSTAPFVLGDRVIMNVGKVIAFDKKTGREVWQTSKNYGDAYATPIEFDAQGTPALAIFNRTGLVLIAQKDGSQIAVFEWSIQPYVNAAHPVVTGNKVFISSGYNHGCALLEHAGSDLKPLWTSKIMRTHMNAVTLWQDHLYGYDDSVFKCIDLQGNEKWSVRGIGKAAHILADGKLILLSGRGELIIAEATPEEFRELSRRKVLDGGQYWTTPVLLNGLIYVRNSNGDIVCLDHRGS
ncbi:MAG: PQQ-like beta-propeller repeat protein [Phycisphaeraceae bacterium]|nr:PQQ-binding-like beta-propeller repeat protein [Phycisphaerales bacterium]QOJ18731.1 MAG: PQQ-like beta-propeller repeat protein [Phycisphaeraceae bacterium]